MMIDSKAPDYDVLVPCSCRAGEHLRGRLKIFDGKRNVDELLRSGWSMKPQPRVLSQDETQWLMARSFETSIAHAMWEKRKGREVQATGENMDRAALILSRSIGRG